MRSSGIVYDLKLTGIISYALFLLNFNYLNHWLAHKYTESTEKYKKIQFFDTNSICDMIM